MTILGRKNLIPSASGFHFITKESFARGRNDIPFFTWTRFSVVSPSSEMASFWLIPRLSRAAHRDSDGYTDRRLSGWRKGEKTAATCTPGRGPFASITGTQFLFLRAAITARPQSHRKSRERPAPLDIVTVRWPRRAGKRQRPTSHSSRVGRIFPLARGISINFI